MIEVYIDGLCEPVNPGGVACYGISLKGDVTAQLHGVIGQGQKMSNNVAEFSALVKALTVLLPYSESTIRIYSDSQLLVNVMTGRWRPRGGLYLPYCKDALKLAERFDNISYVWIPRERNAEADALSRKAYELWCEAHGKPVQYATYMKRPLSPESRPVTSRTCMNCNWMRIVGPHFGCYREGKWRRWIPKKFARTSHCEHYVERK